MFADGRLCEPRIARPTRFAVAETGPAQNVWEAILRRPDRFLASSWPWRSIAYLASGVLLGVGIAAVALVLLLTGVLLLVAVAGAALLMALALLGIPVAQLERARLRLVDAEPLPDQHVQVMGTGVRIWLRVRLREQITWRELGFAALTLFGLCWVDFALLMIAIGFPALVIATPLYTVDQDSSRWFVGAAGLLLLPIGAYLVAVWAGARASLVRALLGPQDSELGARLLEVSRSRARLVAAFEHERQLIERDLHDGAQRHLLAVSMSLGMARLDLAPGSPAIDLVEKAQEHAERALQELRALIRGVHPHVLTDRGLPAAVNDIVGDVPIPVDVDIRLSGRLPVEIETTAYFCLSEALTNVTRHSGATRARVLVYCQDGLLVAEVSDDGHGGADTAAGRGLAGLVDRLSVLDGRLVVRSPPGGPTAVRLELPVGTA